jgi:hypothetical protein
MGHKTGVATETNHSNNRNNNELPLDHFQETTHFDHWRQHRALAADAAKALAKNGHVVYASAARRQRPQ